jgi:alkanesulfonate monooxygenase SsuD/methylene tetrahydromethanopterin reductase-like flavin-dependent oxidoreductase (luciferase family)
MVDISLTYDMRAPEFGAAPVDLYQAAVAQSAWADTAGFASVTLTEHHASTDGYLPSPIVLGAAIAAVTERLLIRLSVVLLPLYHPLRAAEDLAVLDLISNGRLRLTVAAGYRPIEYEQLGLNIRQRPSLMESGIETLKAAWTGEPFEYDGQTVQVLPRPAQEPRPSISLGGASPATARRAARMCDGYQPIGDRLYEIYLEELDKLGRPHPEVDRIPGDGGPLFVHVARDPDNAWEQIAPHALHESNSYAEWAAGARGGVYSLADDPDELRSSGQYLVLTPEQACELAVERGALNLKPLMGGMDPDLGWESLRLVADEVLPVVNP